MIDAAKITDIQERMHNGATAPEDVKYLLDTISQVQAQFRNNPKLEAWSFIGRLLTAVSEDVYGDFLEEHVVYALRAHGMPRKLIEQLLDDEVLAYTIEQEYRFFISSRTVKLVRFALELANQGVYTFRQALDLIHEEKFILGTSQRARAIRAIRTERLSAE